MACDGIAAVISMKLFVEGSPRGLFKLKVNLWFDSIAEASNPLISFSSLNGFTVTYLPVTNLIEIYLNLQ
jgi:hypothetical protein